MLTQQKQKAYYQKRSQRVMKHFHAFIQAQDPEELHHLRVEIKKLKALVSFSEKCSKDKKIAAHFKKTKKLFKAAGLVRSAQVNLEIINKYKMAGPAFKKEHSRLLKNHSQQFLKKADQLEKRWKEVHKKIVKDLQDIEGKCMVKVYLEYLQELSLLFSDQDLEKNLHEGRKIIKNLLYMYNLLPSVTLKKLHLNIPYLKKLEDQIGKWHDNILAYELLLEGNMDNATTKKIETNTKRMFKLIQSSVEEFPEKATRIVNE